MHFLPDVYVPCDVCKGQRYNRETLEVKYKGKSIYDVLEMTVEEALDFFRDIPKLATQAANPLRRGPGLCEGGPARHHPVRRRGPAGEAGHRALQALHRAGPSISWTSPPPACTSPTCTRLIDVLQRLVDAGNTVVVIEHNLDVIKTADHIIDLGPEGGNRGGTIVAQGTPEQVAQVAESYTGQYLRPLLGK